ncbi:hypothetical protein RD792_001772, partial [Penstemon davidsonii]
RNLGDGSGFTGRGGLARYQPLDFFDGDWIGGRERWPRMFHTVPQVCRSFKVVLDSFGIFRTGVDPYKILRKPPVPFGFIIMERVCWPYFDPEFDTLQERIHGPP